MPETMRRYIRHPSELPIRYRLGGAPGERALGLKDFGRGGLCFKAEQAVPAGSAIAIEIPVKEPPFRADGVVAWCREGDVCEVGVCFSGDDTLFTLRMVEQICYIEHYRRQVWENQGRRLSSESAAREWIARYAHRFPI